MPKRSKRIIYLGIIGLLTSTTISACYWQTTRYFESKARWRLISQELSKKEPDSLAQLKPQEIFALKYVQVEGSMSDKIMRISRAKESRMGYLIVRALQYTNGEGQQQVMLAVEGWIPQQFSYTPKSIKGTFKGILREKQKSDYLHKKMKEADIQKFNINTYIDIDKAISYLKLEGKKVCRDYYFETLKDIDQSEDNYYPYQYSVDNFQLPYLTPDKHRAYAMFWGLTSIVGLGAMAKVLKMK